MTPRAAVWELVCVHCHHPALDHDLVHGRRVLVLRCLLCPDGSICAFRKIGEG